MFEKGLYTHQTSPVLYIKLLFFYTFLSKAKIVITVYEGHRPIVSILTPRHLTSFKMVLKCS